MKLYVVEKRDGHGQLDFSEPQPPFPESGATLNQIYDYWFLENAGPTHGPSPAELNQELALDKGWFMREKTW